MGIDSVVGIPWPLTTGTIGKLEFAKGENVLSFSLRALLGIAVEEVPMVPALGSEIDGIVFENMTPLQQARIQRSIQSVVRQFEPRVELVGIRFRQQARAAFDEEAATFVDVEYRAAGVSGSFEIPVGTPTS